MFQEEYKLPLIPNNQSFAQIIASTFLCANELRNLSRTRPPLLKVDSDATVETGMLKISRAMEASSG